MLDACGQKRQIVVFGRAQTFSIHRSRLSEHVPRPSVLQMQTIGSYVVLDRYAARICGDREWIVAARAHTFPDRLLRQVISALPLRCHAREYLFYVFL